MEPEGSLPHSQAPAICPNPEPGQSSPHTHIHYLILAMQNYFITITLPVDKNCSVNARKFEL
jgi:hypothetical protein